MKCPYITSETTVQIIGDFNFEEAQRSLLIERNDCQMSECIKEECAAWQDGKCNYHKK